MTLFDQLTVTGYVSIAAFLSMIIGLDRERRNKSAGLRTHMLVGVGSCLFTSLSFYAFPNADTSRIAAQVVSGIGFLGAGVIFKSKGTIKDLTTAADIWATAAVGMAVGVGAWFIALTTTLLIWLILAVFWRINPNGNDNEEED